MFQKAHPGGTQGGLTWAGRNAALLPLPCSFHWAPGPSPWEQLVPEGAGGRPGEPTTQVTLAALLLLDQSSVCGWCLGEVAG